MTRTTSLAARPEPIEVDPAHTALFVVDMQNAYVSRGGYLDLLNMDISGAIDVATAIQEVLAPARASGISIIYLQLGWDANLREAGGVHSANYKRHNAIRLMRRRPELAGKLLTKGGWDYAIIDALKPQPTDWIIERPRQSGFSGTDLDNYLRSRGITTLVFTGIASNICVESTIREAYFREYYPILIEDCAWQAGPRFVHEATVFNVETFFGWVTSRKSFIESLHALTPEYGSQKLFPAI